jgi:hypothetical protein
MCFDPPVFALGDEKEKYFHMLIGLQDWMHLRVLPFSHETRKT